VNKVVKDVLEQDTIIRDKISRRKAVSKTRVFFMVSFFFPFQSSLYSMPLLVVKAIRIFS
jgi:hypothetical protein